MSTPENDKPLAKSSSNSALGKREFTIGGTKITLTPATEGTDLLGTIHIKDYTNPTDDIYQKLYKDIYKEKAMERYKQCISEVIRAKLNGDCMMSRAPDDASFDTIILSHDALFPAPASGQTIDSVVFPPDYIEKVRSAALPLIEETLTQLEKNIPDIPSMRGAFFDMDPMVARILTSRLHQEKTFAEQAATHRTAEEIIRIGERELRPPTPQSRLR